MGDHKPTPAEPAPMEENVPTVPTENNVPSEEQKPSQDNVENKNPLTSLKDPPPQTEDMRFEVDKLEVPEGVVIDDAMKKTLQDVAKTQGVTTAQMNALIKLNSEHQQFAQQTQIKALNDAVSAIPKEERQLALQGAERYLPDDLKEKVLGEHAILTPDVVRILAILGKVGGEGKFIEGTPAPKKENKLAALFPSMNHK